MPFNRPTLPQLKQRAAADLNANLAGTDALLRRSNTNVLATVHAGASHGMYGYLNYLADQLMPDSAEAEYLERWASIWGVYRKDAATATGPAILAGNDGETVPEGSELQTASGTIYVTTADAVIAAGQATVNVIAQESGINGNVVAGSQLSFINPIEGVSSDAVAGDISGGIDSENDKSLLLRLLKRIQFPPHGGADFDYVDWALEVPGVTRAWCLPNWLGIGTVGVTFVCDDQEGSILPSGDQVAAVTAYIESHIDPVTGKKTGRPTTAEITVFAPVLRPINPAIRIVPDTAAVRSEVTAELADMLRREAEPGRTILLSWQNEAISVASGETDHKIIMPLDDFRPASHEIATLGEITWA